MPEYLAPGVYVEEVSFRPKTIEGVSTSTAGFVGPARFGPIEGEPELLTSFNDFERIYGGIDQLEYSSKMHNYLAHAVRSFFDNGGKRLYVSRVYKAGNGDGYAGAKINFGSPAGTIDLKARYPGQAGNVPVTFSFRIGQNVLSSAPDPANPEGSSVPVLRGVSNFDVVLIRSSVSSPNPAVGNDQLYWVERYFDENMQQYSYQLHHHDGTPTPLTDLDPNGNRVHIITVDVSIGGMGRFGDAQTWEGLSFHPDHRRALTKLFASEPPINRTTELYIPIEISTDGLNNGVAIAETLLNQYVPLQESPSQTTFMSTVLSSLSSGDSGTTSFIPALQILLRNGSDGERPDAEAYKGDVDSSTGLKSGILTFEDLENISIVAAPGASFGYENGYHQNTDTILSHLISHCERMRYRIAVLDSANSHLLSNVRSYRGQLDSTHAALYYPWVRVLDPVTEQEINLPPSGFVAGIYARNDVEHGVHKAPANEVVRGAIGFEVILNKAQQDVLNPEGINCFRFFEGRGYRLWGARTITSDPEWKYVNLRRYFAYLERSIEKGTQWVVFANNSEPLWSNVRRTVEDFLFNEWKSEHLMGTKPEEAYFVKCDRSTMTQNDIDNGRLVCLIGVAPVRPAEYVIFRIGQWTAERRS